MECFIFKKVQVQINIMWEIMQKIQILKQM